MWTSSSLTKPGAESGYFCVNTPGPAGMQSKEAQEPVAEWPVAEPGSVGDAGSWSGQNYFSGGGPQKKPLPQATDRTSRFTSSWRPRFGIFCDSLYILSVFVLVM